MANLLNSGIIPMTFIHESDYDKIDMGDILKIDNIRKQIQQCRDSKSCVSTVSIIKNGIKSKSFKVNLTLSKRQLEIILAGGLLNYTKANQLN